MALVFISHSSKDVEQATAMLAWLREQGFEHTFLDFDKDSGIPPGVDWERRLYQEVARAEVVILVHTANWVSSKWCFAEFAQARALGKAIFPVIENPTAAIGVAPDIQSVDITTDRAAGLRRLATELTRVALDARGGFPWDAARPPYPGLSAYDETDAAIYFGRDDDVRRLIERLNARRSHGGAKLLALFGASGSGKSSLMRAGVLARLRRDRRNWIVAPAFRPQKHPIEELAQALALGFGPAGDWRRIRKQLSSATVERALRDLARDLRTAQGANEAQILISIDQGEELFETSDKAEAGQLWAVLDTALRDDLPFIVLLGLRSDYLTQLQEAPGLKARFEEFSLKPLALERTRQIVEAPAKIAGLTIEDGLVAALMRDAGTAAALPLVAFVLRQLYDRHRSSRTLALSHYEALREGDLSPLDTAIRDAAQEAIHNAGASKSELTALREALVPSLVRINDEGGFVRQPARLDVLPPESLGLIRRLADARLLTISDQDGAPQVEVAHEFLFKVWPAMSAWLDEEREFLVGRSRLEKALEDYRALPEAGRAKGLISGLLLERARAWLDSHPRRFSKEEGAFIRASANEVDRLEQERAAERESLRLAELARAKAETAQAQQREGAAKRFNRWAIGAALVLAVLGAVATKFWIDADAAEKAETLQRSRAESQRNQALLAQSRFLAALSAEQLKLGDGGAAVLLALEALLPGADAVERPHTVEAESALSNAVRQLREQTVLAGHTNSVSTASFAPNGRHVLTASADGTARIWEADSGQTIRVLRGHAGAVTSAAFSADGRHVVTGSADSTARIWDAQSGELITVLEGHGGPVLSVAFGPDGSRVVTGSADNTARVWNAPTWTTIGVLRGHTGPVQGAAFGPDGSRIATASADYTARIWNMQSFRVDTIIEDHTGPVHSVSFSQDGRWLMTAAADKTVRIWDIEAARTISILEGHQGPVRSARFDRDGISFVSASDDTSARIWDTNSGAAIITLKGHSKALQGAAFNPEGTRLVTASEDHTARIWNLGAVFAVAKLEGHRRPVFSASFSPNGRQIATGSGDATARVWALETGEMTIMLAGHTGAVLGTSFSPDGRLLATASDDGTARIWDLNKKVVASVLQGHGSTVFSVAFSPDGRSLVTASTDKSARIWDATTGALVRTLEDASDLYRAAFSPDGLRIITASRDGAATIWDLQSGRKVRQFEGHDGPVFAAAFSPDSGLIVTASGDGTARIWNATNSDTLRALKGHEGPVLSAAFSPDGRLVVTASWDKTVRVWETATGSLIATFGGHAEAVFSAAFSPDSKRVASASRDQTVAIHDIEVRPSASIQGSGPPEHAKMLIPRCLDGPQREAAFLDLDPPVWCVELKKWPYESDDWQTWLAQKRKGLKPPRPIHPRGSTHDRASGIDTARTPSFGHAGLSDKVAAGKEKWNRLPDHRCNRSIQTLYLRHQVRQEFCG